MGYQRLKWSAIAVGLGLLVVTGIALASAPNEAPNLKASAVAALGVADGQCVQEVDVMRETPNLVQLDAASAGLNGPGRVNGVFYGTGAELAIDPMEVWSQMKPGPCGF